MKGIEIALGVEFEIVGVRFGVGMMIVFGLIDLQMSASFGRIGMGSDKIVVGWYKIGFGQRLLDNNWWQAVLVNLIHLRDWRDWRDLISWLDSKDLINLIIGLM